MFVAFIKSHRDFWPVELSVGYSKLNCEILSAVRHLIWILQHCFLYAHSQKFFRNYGCFEILSIIIVEPKLLILNVESIVKGYFSIECYCRIKLSIGLEKFFHVGLKHTPYFKIYLNGWFTFAVSHSYLSGILYVLFVLIAFVNFWSLSVIMSPVLAATFHYSSGVCLNLHSPGLLFCCKSAFFRMILMNLAAYVSASHPTIDRFLLHYWWRVFECVLSFYG